MAKGKKVIVVILDGVGDRPCRQLNGKTPLESAKTPNLDFFAENGKTGYMYSVKEKIAPESDVAITSILGYDPYKYFTGRGPLEAFGAGIKIDEGDLALRTNFATIKIVKGEKKLIDRRAGRTLTTREAEILTAAINKKIKLQTPLLKSVHFIFKSTFQHRGVLILKGGFSDNISNTDPAYIKKGSFGIAAKISDKVGVSKALDDEEETQLSANLINYFVEQSYEILNNHPINKERVRKGLLPANIILTRDAGSKLPDFPKKKEEWGAIVSLPLEKALAKMSGMHILKFSYPALKTSNIYKNLYEGLATEIKYSIKYLKSKFKRYSHFYVHFKETDIPGHDGLPLEKKKMIEMIDRDFFSFVRKLKNIILVVTADHATPCSLKAHSDDSVPLLIYGKGKDKTKRLNEKECRKGSLGKIYGQNLLKSL